MLGAVVSVSMPAEVYLPCAPGILRIGLVFLYIQVWRGCCLGSACAWLAAFVSLVPDLPEMLWQDTIVVLFIMALLETPSCEFGSSAPDFSLPGTDGRTWTLADCSGDKGTVVMFICNHCPYVQAVRERLVQDMRDLLQHGVRAVAIMPNDTDNYPEDNMDNMIAVASEFDFPFPYLLDATQQVAHSYGAVCTPDFFGYDASLGLQYRGRLDAGRLEPVAPGTRRDLYEAMVDISTGSGGPEEQLVSAGCSIKWR